MSRRMLRRAAALAALSLLGACHGDAGSRPEPGTLSVRLTTPNADDGALVITLTGPTGITGVTAAGAGAVVHARTSGGMVRAAVFGPLTNGEVLRFSVPDVNQSAQYQATVLEVADRSNQLRVTATGYVLSISR